MWSDSVNLTRAGTLLYHRIWVPGVAVTGAAKLEPGSQS